MRVLWLCSLSLLLSSCSQKLPGKDVGTYEVTMHLEENSCGETAVYLRDGDRYSVELRADGGKAYWVLADGKPVQGERNSDAFKFTISSIVASETGDAGPNRCQLQQDEVLEATLHKGPDDEKARSDEDAGAQSEDCNDDRSSGDGDSELDGTHVLTISSAGSGDCEVALERSGGAYKTLPCVVRYTIHGEEQ